MGPAATKTNPINIHRQRRAKRKYPMLKDESGMLFEKNAMSSSLSLFLDCHGFYLRFIKPDQLSAQSSMPCGRAL